MTQPMRINGVVYHGPGRPLAIEELLLDPPGPGEIRVRMAAAGVCHSDLHVVDGEWERPAGVVLGHEGAAHVEEIGDGVEHVTPGDLVVLSWTAPCGTCARCWRTDAVSLSPDEAVTALTDPAAPYLIGVRHHAPSLAAAVPALFWLGRMLFDGRTAFLASVLLTTSQLAIVYSQEARAYELLLLVVILASIFFVRADRTGRTADFIAFVAFGTIAMYLHYYAAFFLIACWGFTWVARPRSAK